MDIIWYMFDMIGTVAFAVSGALVGVSRKMDIFGMAVLALATAIGGGVIRDVLLGYFPPNSLRNVVYVTVVLVVTFIVFAIYNSRYRCRWWHSARYVGAARAFRTERRRICVA